MPARRTVLIDAFPDSAFRHRERAAVACIDVMLATTTLVTAAAQGRASPRGVEPGGAARPWPGGLDGADRGRATSRAWPPASSTLTDGPWRSSAPGPATGPLVLASPPGTELVVNAAAGAAPSSWPASATSRPRPPPSPRTPAWRSWPPGAARSSRCEDQMAAAWIAARLVEQRLRARGPPHRRHRPPLVAGSSRRSPAGATARPSSAARAAPTRWSSCSPTWTTSTAPAVCEGNEVRLRTPGRGGCGARGTAAMKATEYDEYEERPGRDVLEYLEIPFRYPRYVWIPFCLILALALLLAMVAPAQVPLGHADPRRVEEHARVLRDARSRPRAWPSSSTPSARWS